MKHIDPYLAEPLSESEAEVLRAYAQGDSTAIAAPQHGRTRGEAEWLTDYAALRAREFLGPTKAL